MHVLGGCCSDASSSGWRADSSVQSKHRLQMLIMQFELHSVA